MARSYLEELRHLIRVQTTQLDTPVANLFGQPAILVGSSGAAVFSQWLLLQLAGKSLNSVDAFYAAYNTAASPVRRVLDTDDGTVIVTNSRAELSTFLLRGTIRLEQARSFTLAVDTATTQAVFAVFVDGVALRQGTGAAELTVLLDPGTHVLEILATSRTLGVKVPSDLLVTAETEQLQPPIWKSLTTGYLDTASAAAANTLVWFVDPRVGGWYVLRRQLLSLTTIATVGTPDTSGEFSALLDGNQVANISIGTDLYAGLELMGAVLSVAYDATDDQTIVRLRLAADRQQTSTFWVGRTATTGRFEEVTRVIRTTGAGEVSWTDASVVTGGSYEYVLQAYGYFDPLALSPFSDTRYVRAGDVDAPAAIVFDAGYPKVVNGTAVVRFVTSADDDYTGVRVYRRRQFTGTLSSATGTTFTLAAPITLDSTLSWSVRITGGTGQGQERQITATLGTPTSVFTVNRAWAANPNGTSTYLIFADKAVATDYGLPATRDQLQFEADTDAGAQIYLFRAFDLSGNEQSDLTAASWSYNPSTDNAGLFNYVTVLAEIDQATTTATVIGVKVTASIPSGTLPGGTPQVRLTALSGATQASGPALNTLSASGTVWTFNRPAPLTQPGRASFEGVLSGYVIDTDTLDIAEQGRDTVALSVRADPVSVTSTQIEVDVTLLDPVDQGGTYATLTVNFIGLGLAEHWNGSSYSSFTTGQMYSVGASSVQRFRVTRGLAGGGNGRIVFTMTAPNRTSDSDSLDVTANAPNLPPTITLEQLTASEQSAFTSFTDVEKYAVLRLAAADPQQADPTASVTIWYKRKNGSTIPLAAATALVAGTVDNPAGTRSRYVLMTRDSDETWLEAWSEDGQGFQSDHVTYTIDFDNSPEVTSLETVYDVGNSVVYVTAIVDDDTQGVRIWMTPAPDVGAVTNRDYTNASPLHVDTRTTKTVNLTVRLSDAQRKSLAVQPWNLFSGGTAQGTAGETVTRDLVRSPRTTITFENRDEQNSVSSKRVRASVVLSPAIAPQATRTSTATGGSATRIADNGSPGWTVNLFAYSDALQRFYFVEFVSGTYTGQVYKIIANGTNYLDITPALTATSNGDQFRIWPGAVVWQVEGQSDAYVVSGVTYFDRRDADPIAIAYHGLISGASPEATHRIGVDANSEAHIELLTASESTANLVTVTVTSADPVTRPPFDDDVKYWRLWARKGGSYPTKTGSAPARDASTKRYNMEDVFFRWEDVPANPSITFNCGDGDWIFIAVPYNSDNEDGDYREARLTVTGAARLTNLTAAASGSSNTNLTWGHTNFTAGPYTVDISAQKYDANGSTIGGAVTVATGLAATTDAATHTSIGTRAAQGSGIWRVWRYTVTLKDNGVAIATYNCQLGDYLDESSASLTSATASNADGGSAEPVEFTYHCLTPLVNLVQWVTSGTTDSDYFMQVSYQYDGVGQFYLAASNLSVSTGQYYHFEDTIFALTGPGTVSRSWTYKVELIRRSDSVVIGTQTCSPVVVQIHSCFV